MFIENPLTGIGLDNFKREYGLYQALYFKMGNYTTKEFLLAGNGYYAFNDYWQFIVETGLIGGSVLIILFYLIIKIICLRIKNYPNDICLILSTSILITICTAALFTHVFAHKAFIIISSFTLFYIVFPIKSLAIKNSFKFLAALLAIFVFSITQYYQEIKNYRYLKNLDEANLLSETGYILRSQEMYADLYPKMKNDVGFLRQYADLLTGEDNLSEKLRILSEIQNQWTDNLLYMKLGRVHEELEHYKKAEAAYLQAVYIVPNRFVTREALYNFYIRINQHKKANYWRKSILLMPIKIPSKRVEQIRNNVRKQKS